MDEQAIQSMLTAAISAALAKQAEQQTKQLAEFQVAIEDRFTQLSIANNGIKNEVDSQSDAGSKSSHSSDVAFLKQLNKPQYKNADAVTKYEQDRLYKIQESLKANIPKLAYNKPDVSSKPTQDEDALPLTHNYLQWQKALFKYYTSLSPVLAETTENFLNRLNVDDFIHGKKSIDFPEIENEDYPDLVKFQAMTAISTTVSEDFIHLVDEDSLVDIFPSLVNLHCTCRPNSADGRSDEMASFWELRMQAGESAVKFGKRLLSAMKAFNSISPTDKISETMLASVLKNGVKKGAHGEQYSQALMTMKFKIENPSFNSMLLWLDQNVDKTKPVNSPPTQQASAVRTRGGGRGAGRGKGRGRGGKSGKGGKSGPGPNRDPDNNDTVNWNQTYYKVQDEDGNDTITKEVADVRSKRPCFTKFEDGKCDDRYCPYNHDFNLADRRNINPSNPPRRIQEEKVSAAEQQQTAQQQPSSNPSASNAQKRVKFTADARSSEDDQDDDGFNYAYDLGFSHSVSAVSVHPSLSLRDCLLSLMLIFSGVLLLVPNALDVAHVFLSQTVAVLLDVVRPGRLAFILGSYSLLLVALAVCLPIFLRTTVMIAKHAASAVYWARGYAPTYQTILDGGCTFTMSGDRSIFVTSSLVPIHETVGLAESGHAVDATHFGKACVGGEFLDALYVPKFKQTMVSMGQLEKMGLRYTVVGNIRNFLTPNNSIFLSFTLAANNLYVLASSNHSSSSASY